jgi:hypothetical protein
LQLATMAWADKNGGDSSTLANPYLT